MFYTFCGKRFSDDILLLCTWLFSVGMPFLNFNYNIINIITKYWLNLQYQILKIELIKKKHFVNRCVNLKCYKKQPNNNFWLKRNVTLIKRLKVNYLCINIF